VPLLAALVPALKRSEKVVLPLSVLSAAVVFSLVVIATIDVLTLGGVVAIPHWIELDGFGALLELLISFVGMTAALYSWGDLGFGRGTPGQVRGYAANFNLFVMSMLAIPLTVEPGLAWIAVGLTTLFSVLLVSYENTHDALEAAWKYATLTLVGSAVAVLGFLVLFWAMRTAGGDDFTWRGLAAIASHLPPALVTVAFAFILIGLGTKTGLVPLHTWLPDAHSQAPSPVCALLSGVETSTALYVILRLVPVFRSANTLHVNAWLLIVGFISLGTAAFLLLQAQDYKRLFAFSTVEHMGIVLVAVGMGTALASYGAAWQLATHALAKSLCFYASGAALAAFGTRMIANTGDLVGRSRIAAVALFIGVLAIAGAPPFAVFLSEFAIARAAFTASQSFVGLMLIFFIGIAFFGLFGRAIRVIFGPPPAAVHSADQAHSVNVPMVTAIVIAMVPVVLFGVWIPEPLARLFELSSRALQ